MEPRSPHLINERKERIKIHSNTDLAVIYPFALHLQPDAMISFSFDVELFSVFKSVLTICEW